jgi:hypothetical protein
MKSAGRGADGGEQEREEQDLSDDRDKTEDVHGEGEEPVFAQAHSAIEADVLGGDDFLEVVDDFVSGNSCHGEIPYVVWGYMW